MFEQRPYSIQLVLPGDDFHYGRIERFCAEFAPDPVNRQLVEMLMDAGSVLTQPHRFSRNRVHEARSLYRTFFRNGSF